MITPISGSLGPASPSSTRTGSALAAAAGIFPSPVMRRLIVWLYGLTGRQHIGPWQRQRPHIGLVGRVRPVALVLHLESVALHPAFGGDARPNLMGDRAQILERLPGIDQISGSFVATTLPSVCSTVTGLPARPAIGCRMQKPQRLVSKSLSGSALTSKARWPSAEPLIVARKASRLPIRPGAVCRIADGESVGALVDDQIGQRRLVGAPVAVAARCRRWRAALRCRHNGWCADCR